MTPAELTAARAEAESSGDAEKVWLIDDRQRCLDRIAALRTALNWFLNDERFQVGVGGNPHAVEKMIAEARKALGETQ